MLMNRTGKLPIKVVIIVAVVVLLGGVAAFVMKPHGKGGEKKAEKGPVTTMVLGDFVVNLADADEVRYLKANIVIEVSGEAPAGGGHGESSGPDPRLRDAVIEVLSSKHFAELVKPDGKDKLKEDIIATVNKRLDTMKVEEVFFNEFAMQ